MRWPLAYAWNPYTPIPWLRRASPCARGLRVAAGLPPSAISDIQYTSTSTGSGTGSGTETNSATSTSTSTSESSQGSNAAAGRTAHIGVGAGAVAGLAVILLA